jgi:SAM-dependent methyltransferase
MRLHLGSFDQPVPGWLNTDITPHIWISRIPGASLVLGALGVLPAQRVKQHREGVFRHIRYLDVRRRFPLESGSVEAIYTAHMLEHLYEDEAAHCLRECVRVLRPGGVMRIGVPDLDWIVAGYRPEEPREFLVRIFEVSARRASKNVHHWHYNEVSLRHAVLAAGFSAAARCDYRNGRCPDVALLDTRPEETLFLEAIR